MPCAGPGLEGVVDADEAVVTGVDDGKDNALKSRKPSLVSGSFLVPGITVGRTTEFV